MTRDILKQTIVGAGLLFLGGCVLSPNEQEHALTVQEQHPITVDSQVVTLTLDGTEGLSAVDRSRLRALAISYNNNGHGPLTITTPSGGSNVSATAEQARDALYDAGVSLSAISSSSYIANQSVSNDIILSYTRYVATPSACGIWEDPRSRDSRNLRSAEFGCATQSNLAAMIGDPRDLVATDPLTDPDAVFRVRGVNAYREGEAPVSETDSEIEARTEN